MDIRFADHASFQRAAAGMVGGALLFGTALHPVTALAPLVGGALGVVVGARIAHGPAWPRGWRGVGGAMFGVLAVAAGLWCATRIGVARQTAHWPAIVRAMVASAAVGLVGLLAMLPRHVALVADPVRGALAKLPAALDAEVRGLCDRAVKIWAAAKDQVTDDASRDLIRDGVLTTLEVAAKSGDIRAAGHSEAELARRLADLDGRIAAATDREVIAQYEAARAAVADQQRYRETLKQRRERLVARMHNHVAALERFELGDAAYAATVAESAHELAAG